MRLYVRTGCAIAQRISSCATYRWLVVVIFLSAITAMPRSVQATSITFAQFTEAGAGGNLFAYIDNGSASDAQFGTSTGGPLGASIPVNFTYLTVAGSLPADLQGNQAAHLTMTSSSKTPASILGGIIGNQPITGLGDVSDTITITRDTQAAEGNNGRTILLQVTYTGQLLGLLGGRTPQLSSDTALENNTITYSSDFLTFNNDLERDFSLTFSSWTNTGNGGGLAQAVSNYFASATASGTGTFDASATAVPEPATWLLGALGVLLMATARRWLPGRVMVKCPVRR